MSICQKAGSLIQSVHPRILEGAIVLGSTALSGYLAGIPSALTTLATYFAGRKYIIAPMEAAHSVEKKRTETTAARFQIPDSSRMSADAWSLDQSAVLSAPSARPPILEHQNNSCFLAAALQIILANSALLEEFPGAIARRLEWMDLFDRRFEEMCDISMSEQQLDLLASLASEICPRGSLTLRQIGRINELLHKLEVDEFPPFTKKENINELLSLLELYEFIIKAQFVEGASRNNEKVAIKGNVIHSLRGTLARINSRFEKNGTNQCDASDALRTFIEDLILKNSRHVQNQIAKRAVAAISSQRGQLLPMEADEKGVVTSPPELSTWGWFPLNPLPNQGKTLASAFAAHINSSEKYLANYQINKENEKKMFEVVGTWSEVEFPPEYLVISNCHRNLPIPNAEMSVTFARQPPAPYRLCGVINHRGEDGAGHCTALVTRGRRFYHVNDLGDPGNPYCKEYTEQEVLNEASKMGQVFIFKKS